jgi:hypothetical protein
MRLFGRRHGGSSRIGRHLMSPTLAELRWLAT